MVQIHELPQAFVKSYQYQHGLQTFKPDNEAFVNLAKISHSQIKVGLQLTVYIIMRGL